VVLLIAVRRAFKPVPKPISRIETGLALQTSYPLLMKIMVDSCTAPYTE